VTRVGFPPDRPYYVDCLLRFLTLLRTSLAADLLSTSGYPIEGYTLQGSLREQVFALAGVASKLTTLHELRGYDKVPAGNIWSNEDRKKVAQAQMAAERRVRQSLLRDNLSEKTVDALRLWDRLFHQQVHGSQLTYFVEFGRLVERSGFSVGPVPTEDFDAMYMNRSHEIGWMILRQLPFLQLKEAPFDCKWVKDWRQTRRRPTPQISRLVFSRGLHQDLSQRQQSLSPRSDPPLNSTPPRPLRGAS
jgi:hypothetical protein